MPEPPRWASVPDGVRVHWIPGQPVPQGSMRAFVARGQARVRHASGRSLETWREAVGWEMRRQRPDEPPLVGAVGIALAFRLVAPASEPKRRRTWPCRRPDLDKLVRAVLDAITGVVVLDDAQVVQLVVDEDWGPAPGAWIGVWRMEDGIR